MAKSATIHARVDPQTKSKVQKILNDLGISMSDVISIYLKQIVLHKGLPFEVKIPTNLTEETLRKSERHVDVHEVSCVDELFEELDS